MWLTFLLYGMLLPGSLIGALMYWFVVFDGVFYAVSIEATAVLFAMVVLDVWVNRQPYYYAFHGVAGAVLSMGYLLFTVIYWAAGGEDPNGFPYIYRALNWERPSRRASWCAPPARRRGAPPRAPRRSPSPVPRRLRRAPAPNAGDADPLHRLPALQHADLVPRVGAPPGADQRQGEAERVIRGRRVKMGRGVVGEGVVRFLKARDREIRARRGARPIHTESFTPGITSHARSPRGRRVAPRGHG